MIRFMNIRKILTTALLSLTTVTTVGTLLVNTAYAENSKATLKESYMGTADASGEITPTAAAIPDSVNVGDIVWVGVGIDDIQNFNPLVTNGISSMEMAFYYDPYYMQPCTKSGKTWSDVADDYTEESLNNDWLSYISEYNFAAGAASDDAQKWDSEIYEFVDYGCTIRTDVTYNAEDYENAPTSDMKMMYLSLEEKDSASSGTQQRFQGITSPSTEETKYIMMLPFKIMNNTKPTADYFVMALGPNTFLMDFTGNSETYAAWEKTTKRDAAINLKTYLDFTGDIDIIGKADDNDDRITNIELSYDTIKLEEDGTETTVTTVVDLYSAVDEGDDHRPTTGDAGFAPDKYTLYANVPNIADKLKLKITKVISSDTLSVDFTDKVGINSASAVSVIAAERKDGESGYPYESADKLELSEVDMSVAGVYGYNNQLTVILGSETYIVNIRRYVEPQIKLNYGNSPVGLIMRDDTITDKEAAIADFDSEPQNKMYGEGNVPKIGTYEDGTPKYAQTARPYTVSAWKSFTDENGDIINHDLNPYTLFVYEAATITDPGYVFYDEYGLEKTGETISISTTLKVQKPGGWASDENVTDLDVTLVDGKYSLTGIIIRPDIYTMTYNCSYNGENVVQERSLIILGKIGDVSYTTIPNVSTNDANYIRSNYTKLDTSIVGNSLVSYRSADASYTTIPNVSTNDANYIRSNYTKLDIDIDGQYYPSIVN